jgi:hypothetical protein
MKLIETKTLLSDTASIVFTSIPQDGTDLFVLATLRNTTNQIAVPLLMAPNSATSGGTRRVLLATTTGQSFSASDFESGVMPSATATANGFGNASIYIPNYTSSTAKSWSSDSVMPVSSGDGRIYFEANLWSGTGAITSLSFTSTSGNFVTGSTISLYKITSGSDGIVTVS